MRATVARSINPRDLINRTSNYKGKKDKKRVGGSQSPKNSIRKVEKNQDVYGSDKPNITFTTFNQNKAVKSSIGFNSENPYNRSSTIVTLKNQASV